jgi:DNA-binding LacI/PurR family transcriptional regulator
VTVPDEVSIVGCDGTAIGEFTYSSLTTVCTPMYDVGKQAFELLLAAIEGKTAGPQSLILPVKLTIRESVGPALTQRKAS